jgi:hypothetical protein
VTHLVEAAPGERIAARPLGEEIGFENSIHALILQLRESALAMEGLLKTQGSKTDSSKKSEGTE